MPVELPLQGGRATPLLHADRIVIPFSQMENGSMVFETDNNLGYVFLAPSTWQAWAAGGAPAGVAVVRAFPFAFDTPDILTGHAVYVPTIGDILLDAWVEIDTVWDGVTPQADVASFAGGNDFGWFLRANNLVVLSAGVDSSTFWADIGVVGQTTAGVPTPNGLVPALISSGNMDRRNLPFKWITADPVKVVVSQDGTVGGADPGSTQGAAILYLVTATPA